MRRCARPAWRRSWRRCGARRRCRERLPRPGGVLPFSLAHPHSVLDLLVTLRLHAAPVELDRVLFGQRRGDLAVPRHVHPPFLTPSAHSLNSASVFAWKRAPSPAACRGRGQPTRCGPLAWFGRSEDSESPTRAASPSPFRARARCSSRPCWPVPSCCRRWNLPTRRNWSRSRAKDRRVKMRALWTCGRCGVTATP
jgi:hypothetical protein